MAGLSKVLRADLEDVLVDVETASTWQSGPRAAKLKHTAEKLKAILAGEHPSTEGDAAPPPE